MIRTIAGRTSSVRELPGLGRQVSAVDHYRVATVGRVKRNGVTAPGLAHALGVHRGGKVLTDDPVGPLVKADAATNLAGVKDRGHFAVRFAIKQETNLDAVHVGAVAAQLALGQILGYDRRMAVFVESNLGCRREPGRALVLYEFRRDQ